jgi:NTP pyrophosphatase (non-canonical NTP hydrolase)
MELNDYQSQAMTTCKASSASVPYMVLLLNGEAGELANRLQKVIRDIPEGDIDDEEALAMAKELGDVLWSVAGCARELGFSLEQIATLNLNKLADRAKRDAIGGSGDER